MINELTKEIELIQIGGGYCFCNCCPPAKNSLGFSYEIFIGLQDQLNDCVTECLNKEGYTFSQCYPHHGYRPEVPVLCFNNSTFS